METCMNKFKSFTSLEQSRVLAEILPIESADFHFSANQSPQGYLEKPIWGNPEYANYNAFPCWSLAALFNYLCEIDFFPEIDADEHTVTMSINYYNEEEARPLAPVHTIMVKAESFIDACYELILKLHELKLI